MKYLDKQGIPPDGLELYERNEKLQVSMDEFWASVLCFSSSFIFQFQFMKSITNNKSHYIVLYFFISLLTFIILLDVLRSFGIVDFVFRSTSTFLQFSVIRNSLCHLTSKILYLLPKINNSREIIRNEEINKQLFTFPLF